MTSTWNRQAREELEAAPRGDLAFVELIRRAFGGSATAPPLGAGPVAAAYASGERGADRLTDLLFNARHPERHGRAIARNEAALAREWRWMRAEVVVPALRVAAAVLAPAAAPRSRYLLPPDPAHLLQPARTDINVVALFPGDLALTAEARLITEVAAQPDGWVYLANWYAGFIRVRPGSARVAEPALLPIATALTDCYKRGAMIRALFWDGSQRRLIPVINGILARLGGTVLAPARQVVRDYIQQAVWDRTNHAVNSASVAAINRLGARAVAALDDDTLPVGSHHQKILVVGNPDRIVAVVGGVDLNADRVEPGLKPNGAPLVDISVQFDGQAAADVADLFERRWRAGGQRGNLQRPPARSGPPASARAVGGATVQVGVNFGAGRPLQEFPHTIRGASRLIGNMLRNCREFFYAEDQYGSGNPELEAAITRAFANGARYGVVVLAGHQVVDDLPEIEFRRHQFWSRFPQINKTLFVFERLGDDGSERGPHAYVHSKLVLVDDRAVSIGSVNMNRRSWSYDSEIAAVVTDAPAVITDLRLAVWRSHLAGVGEQEFRDPGTALALWTALHSGRIRRVQRLRPLSFDRVPARVSAGDHRVILALRLAGAVSGSANTVRTAIDTAMDLAYHQVFDPPDPSSFPRSTP